MMVKQGYRVVITHGNGPQVGNILIQNSEGSKKVPPMPLDVCGAQSQGFIGYMIEQQLINVLKDMDMNIPVATIVTQVIVDKDDPAFKNPSKPVGPFYSKKYADVAIERGENFIEDAGRGWRKVVASPNPLKIVEIDIILSLIEKGHIVIANGGGGIPVVEKGGIYEGVEAVIDKDLSGERLAHSVNARKLMILTDVPKVYINYKQRDEMPLDKVNIAEIERYQREGHFKAGSMGPKIEACRRFIINGGEIAIITSLDMAIQGLNGKEGTIIVK